METGGDNIYIRQLTTTWIWQIRPCRSFGIQNEDENWTVPSCLFSYVRSAEYGIYISISLIPYKQRLVALHCRNIILPNPGTKHVRWAPPIQQPTPTTRYFFSVGSVLVTRPLSPIPFVNLVSGLGICGLFHLRCPLPPEIIGK